MGSEPHTVVIGGSGFVGRHVCQQLSADGAPFIAVGRKPRPPGLAADTYLQIDGLPEGTPQLLPRLSGCRAVIYLAARVHAMEGDGPELLPLYRKANLEAPLAVARAALHAGVRRFVYVSTIKVHGDGTHGVPYRADDTPHPSGAYAQSKYEGEMALRELFGGVPYAALSIVRPPLVYGVGAAANFQRLFRWVSSGRPLPFGAVRNRRSLVGVRNLSDLLIRVSHEDRSHQLLVSDGTALSTAQLVQSIARALGRPARLIPVPPYLLDGAARWLGREDLAQRLWGSLEVDSRATERALAWTPPVSLDAELGAMAAAVRFS